MILRKLGKLNFENPYLLITGAFTCFSVAIFFHQACKRPEIVVSKQESAINVSTLFLKLLSIGNKRLIADTLWIQTLIESDLDHYKGNPLNSWMFLRFNSIAELDPNFYENYLFGGQYLSIVKDDLEGAAQLMERGLKIFPSDYRLNFNQGFNYYFEMGEVKKGLLYLEKIKDNPKAPPYISSLVIKLRHELSQDLNLTLAMLREAYANAKDPTLTYKLDKDIYAVKATMDLQCLNEVKSDCDRKDAYGKAYTFEKGRYKAQSEFRPYQLHKKKKGPSEEGPANSN